LHAKRGFGKLSAAVRSDFVDGAGVFYYKGADIVHGVGFVFGFVCFPHFAQFFKEDVYFGVNFGVLFGFGVDFSCSQEIIERAAFSTFSAQERQID
jgi:hypothetical protein